MRLLSNCFIKKGFEHTQIQRSAKVAIYKRNHVDYEQGVHYEVIVIRKHNGSIINGNVIEPGELYPGESQWGIFGWTFFDPHKAKQKFIELVDK